MIHVVTLRSNAPWVKAMVRGVVPRAIPTVTRVARANRHALLPQSPSLTPTVAFGSIVCITSPIDTNSTGIRVEAYRDMAHVMI